MLFETALIREESRPLCLVESVTRLYKRAFHSVLVQIQMSEIACCSQKYGVVRVFQALNFAVSDSPRNSENRVRSEYCCHAF